MLNIRRVCVVSLILSCFFAVDHINAQQINQFNKHKKRTGIWRKYYPNGRIRYEGQFKNGKEIGTFKFYDITTSKFPVVIKKYSSSSDTAHVRFFTLKGKLKTTGQMIGKKRVGKWMYYFLNGKTFSEEYYKDGKLEGTLKNYYNSGKLLEETEYKNGLKNGISKRYADSGTLIEEVRFVNGKENGEAKYYELNGNLKEKGTYKNGNRVGKWEFYIGGEAVSDKKKKESKKFKKQ